MCQKPSILVVDDQENWRNLLQSLLSSDYDVLSVGSYSSGLEAYRAKFPPYDVIIADMCLDAEIGNEDGLRLIEEVQKQSSYTQTIVLTGYPSIETVKRALRHHKAYEYIEKFPSSGQRFDHKEFLRVVKEAVDKAEVSKRIWEHARARDAWIAHCRKAFLVLPEVDPGVDERLCFVIMPFSKDFDLIYDCISGAIVDCPGCECRRADDVHQPGMLMNQIWISLNEAGLIIADLTNRNPNVFYELGLCHALGKRTILLAQRQTHVPRHLGSLGCIQYARTARGLVRLRRQLTGAIQDALGTAADEWNLFPKRDYGPDDVERNSCVIFVPQVPTAITSSTTAERDLAESSRWFYEELVSELLDGEGLAAIEVNNIFSPRLAIEAIWEQINKASLVIADMSSRSPEIFYAVGLAHALHKPVILLTSEPDNVPFDLRHVRYTRYTPDLSEPDGGIEFVEELRTAIRDTFRRYADIAGAMSIGPTTVDE